FGFGDGDAADLVRLIALFTALQAAFQIGLNLLLGLQSIALRNLTETVRIVFCFAFVYALLRSGGTSALPAWGYIWSTLVATIMVVVIIALFHRELLTAPVTAGHPGLRDVFRVGKYLSIAFGGVLVFSQMDTVMLSAMTRDMNAVAAYQLAVPTLMILYALILAGARNFMPMASVLAHRNQYELLGAGLKRIVEAAFAVIVPATALMACYSDVLMETLFRSDVMGAPAAFNILAVGSIFFFTCNICLNTLAGVDRSRQAALAIGAALVLNVVLNVVLIRRFGILGAASATVASHFVATAISFLYIRQRVPFHLSLARLASPVLVSAFMSALALAFRKTNIFSDYPQLGAAAAFCLLYAGALAVLEFTGLARLRQLARTFQHRKEYPAVDTTPPAG
ncbi:MAG: polysaccharide biosynthesis C-terminal domain-containing protein, partial [Candidatus Hydrogenedentes bacterium]|nr:polysaccharide biosynthesis C-terminal domain-containing protein [Candidatus Hydrogenedentota bacterium]